MVAHGDKSQAGSGCIVSKDGLILTAAHLFYNLAKDNENYWARVDGTDGGRPSANVEIQVGIVRTVHASEHEEQALEYCFYATGADLVGPKEAHCERRIDGKPVDVLAFRIRGTIAAKLDSDSGGECAIFI